MIGSASAPGAIPMRTLLAVAVTVTLIPAARGQDAARALIEKAIQAHGGPALDKYPAGRAKVKGTIVLRGSEAPFVMERVFQMPGKLKITFEYTSQNVPRAVTEIANGNAVVAYAGGLAQELPKNQVQELHTALYVGNLARLTPLLKDKKYKLALAEDKTFEGKPAVGVIVSAEGSKDVRLYFDRQTNLLLAIERMGFDEQGKPAEHLDLFSDYREANGLKYPTRTLVKQNGKRYLESETTEFKPLERVDSREFQINPP
jgi:hypothetical protein